MGIFDSKNVEKANEDAAKKKGVRITEPGIYEMTFTKGVVRQSKTGNWMIVLTFTPEEFDDIDSYYVFNKEKPEQALKIIAVFKNGFDHTFEAIDAMTDKEEAEEALKQVESYIGQKLMAAVSIEEDIYEKKDDQTGKFLIFRSDKPKIWYVGMIGKKLSINKAKAITRLSPDKQAKWDKYKLANPPRTKDLREDDDMQEQPIKKEEEQPAPTQQELDDLPFILLLLLGTSLLPLII